MPSTRGPILLLLCTLLLAGCGGGSSVSDAGPANPNLRRPPKLSEYSGTPMAPVPHDAFDGDNPDRGVSASFTKFFVDTVNQHSGGRWQWANFSGAKQWTLSNTCFSTPKAWVLGQNYWNNEDDELVSNDFVVPDDTDGLRVSFYSRWNILAGDTGEVWFWDGTMFHLVTTFTGGSNADYPNWTKYTYDLPANNSGLDQTCSINFIFTSNGSGTSWGFGVDTVSVYQRQLAVPTGVDATDGDSTTVVSWDADTDILVPDAYEVWRSDAQFGTYELVDTVNDPATNTSSGDVSDLMAPASNWYKVRAVKAGWQDGPFSAATSGNYEGTWTIVTVDDPGLGDAGYWGDIALIDGKPAMCYRDGLFNSVRYAYSSTPTGAQLADWTVITLPSTGVTQPGREISLAEVNGAPAISYCDNNSGDLIYQRATTAVGGDAGDWITPVHVQDTNDVGYNSELMVIGGTPAIVFDDISTGDLKYTHATTMTGANAADWTTTNIAIDNDSSAGGASLGLVSSNPAVAYFYFDGMDEHIRYSRATTSHGNSAADWGTKTTFVDDSVSGLSLAVIDGFPALSFQGSNSGDLHFVRADDSDGDGWTGTILQIDTATSGLYTSLLSVNGYPAIAYHDGNNSDLLYVNSTTTTGSAGSWGNIETIESTGNVGRYATLIMVDGNKPAIFYRDDSLQAAKYAVKQ
jgi:hypothetical protein